MAVGIVAVFIPIVTVLVIGLIFVSYYYYRSRERQMLIEKGLDAQSIKQFFESKKDPYRLMKIGIIAVAFGIGLGLGMALQDSSGKDYWIPFLLFTFTGIGFVVANIVSRKLEKSTSN
jgi:purine-cytosine permease-like protein